MAMTAQPAPAEVEEVMQRITNSCAIRSIAGAGLGYGMGIVFPMVMFAFGGGMGMGDTTVGVSARTHWKAYKVDVVRAVKQARHGAGGWAMIGFLFGGLELAVEKRRARHDIWNPTLTGFVVGAVQARKGGPLMSFGAGAGFAAFSAAMFWFMPH
eukprot:EG_transcript_31130